MRILLPLSPSLTINITDPNGESPRRIEDKNFKKTPYPPCLEEALRRMSFV
jgi:hypothetical protein